AAAPVYNRDAEGDPMSKPHIPFVAILVAGASLAPLAFQQDKPADPAEAKVDGFTPKTDATITFTTDEVTWPSLDVSPDGRTIVFDLVGDLYTLPIEGGEAKRIMGGLSFESQ